LPPARKCSFAAVLGKPGLKLVTLTPDRRVKAIMHRLGFDRLEDLRAWLDEPNVLSDDDEETAPAYLEEDPDPEEEDEP
jgi:hypothetical protein